MQDDALLDASFMASAFDSGLSDYQVQRIISVIAEIDDITFEGARKKCVEYWEAECLRAREKNMTTEAMWARLVRIANRVPKP
jgi:hypothetical protein